MHSSNIYLCHSNVGRTHYIVLAISFCVVARSDLAIPLQKEKLAKFTITTALTSNFIGIVFARTLHYQFYSWYFYSLPYLLWQTDFPVLMRVLILLVIEICFNVYPANTVSSISLQVRCIHVTR